MASPAMVKRPPRVGIGNVPRAAGRATAAGPPEPEFWRRSAVEAVLQCTAYVNESGAAAQFGSAFHLAVKLYTRWCFDRQLPSDWDVVARTAAQAFALSGGLHPDQLDDLVELLDHFAHTRMVPTTAIEALEEPLIADSGLRNPKTGAPIWWRGQLDMLLRDEGGDPDEEVAHYIVVDYKTHRAVAYNLFQGRFYAMLVFLAKPNAQRVTVLFDYVRPLVRGRRGEDPVELVYERGELDAWWSLVVQAFIERLSQTPTPTGCMACEYCASRHRCGETLAPYKDVPETMEEAIEVARNVLRAGQVGRSGKARLKAFMTDRDPVEIQLGAGAALDMGFLRPRKPAIKVVDPLAVVSRLEAAGFDGKATLVSWVPLNKIPREMQPGLIEDGVLIEVWGEASFKLRKADAKERNQTEIRLKELVRQARELVAEDGGDGEEEVGGEADD